MFGIFHYVSCKNGTERNETIIFIFALSRTLTTKKLEMKPLWYLLIFLNFFAIFLEFSITRRVGMERNDNFYFLSFTAFLQRILAWNEATTVFFNFFVIFLEFSITHWVGTKRNDNFYFLSFPAFSSLFWFKMKSQWYFLIFLIFLPFFWNFVSCLE